MADLGYARVSTTGQDLDRQLDALTAHGIPPDRTWQDKKTGATVNRPGFTELRRYARPGDTIVATNLDRIGRNLRECLNLVHELREQQVGIKTLRDPIPIDTNNDSPMAQIAVAMLALFAEMERTFARERAAHARAVALQKGRLPGRPRKLNDQKLQAARASLDAGIHINNLAAIPSQHPPRNPLPSTPTRQAARQLTHLPCGSGHLQESWAYLAREDKSLSNWFT